MFFALADPEFISRQQTTTNFEQDGSAQSRLSTWRGSLDLFRDYPLGAGGRGFALLSPQYIPDVVAANNGQRRAPHNTVVLILAEWGIAGLVLFAGFLTSTYLVLRDIRKRALQQDFWFYRSVAVAASLTGLLVSCAFSDRLYAEAPFWMAALAITLNRLHLKALEMVPEAGLLAPGHSAGAVAPSWSNIARPGHAQPAGAGHKSS
jgi:O-antigen ligase